MLKKIYIDGFRHFKNFTLEPHFPHTLLCGLNGTGKTSVIDVISRLQKFVSGNLPLTIFYHAQDIPRWEKKDRGSFTATFSIELEIEEKIFSYQISIAYSFNERMPKINKEILMVDSNKIFYNEEGNANIIHNDNKSISFPISKDTSGLSFASEINQHINIFLDHLFKNIFPLSINPFVNYTYNEVGEQILACDANNFSMWYEQKLNANTFKIASSFEAIKCFINGFKGFKLSPMGNGKELFVSVHDKNNAYQLHFNELSEGQKILSILTVLFFACPDNSVIIIDEFENFLSPIELQPLYGVIQDAFEEKNVQTILISHHQKTLNWFQNCAFIFEKAKDSSFITVKDFSKESNISIPDYLFENQEL